jgi:hypothetical protein
MYYIRISLELQERDNLDEERTVDLVTLCETFAVAGMADQRELFAVFSQTLKPRLSSLNGWGE